MRVTSHISHIYGWFMVEFPINHGVHSQRVSICTHIYIYIYLYMTHMTTLWWMVSFETGCTTIFWEILQIPPPPSRSLWGSPWCRGTSSVRSAVSWGNPLVKHPSMAWFKGKSSPETRVFYHGGSWKQSLKRVIENKPISWFHGNQSIFTMKRSWGFLKRNTKHHRILWAMVSAK